MTQLVIGLAIFLGVHSIAIVVPALRQTVVKRFGEPMFQAFYSILTLIGLVMIVQGYGQARGDVLIVYTPPVFLRYTAVVLMVFVFPLLLAAYLPGRIKTALKHPMLVAIKTWAFAHLLANGSLADLVLFGAILAWAVADRISLKRRVGQRAAPALPASAWNDAIAILAGLGIYAAFLAGGHLWLIGIPILS